MDGLKELVEAFSARIKSPIVGSIALAFVAINWRAVFFLFFSGEPASDKFVYFTENTTGLSLYLYPVIVGLAFALLVPWINFLGAKAIESPVTKHRNMQLDAAHDLAAKKTRHTIDMETLDSEYRSALLKGAKVEQEIKEANIDDDVRTDLEEKLSMAIPDVKTVQNNEVEVPDVIPTGAFELLTYLSNDNDGIFHYEDNGDIVEITRSDGDSVKSSGREKYYEITTDFANLMRDGLIDFDAGRGVINRSGYAFLRANKSLEGV